MLAAAAENKGTLELLNTILSSLSEDNGTVPVSESVQDHFVLVIKNAVEITQNPSLIDSKTSSEALEIALKIKDNPDVCAELANINTAADLKSKSLNLLSSLTKYAA